MVLSEKNNCTVRQKSLVHFYIVHILYKLDKISYSMFIVYGFRATILDAFGTTWERQDLI